MVIFITGTVALGGRACIACNGGETDRALTYLQACPAAKERLGDEIGWSVVGCSNYKGNSGGDPLNGGCHSSGRYTSPVAGTKDRGSYSFSTSTSRGITTFNGGWLTLNDGGTITIAAAGTCSGP